MIQRRRGPVTGSCADRKRVSLTEKRTGHSAHLPSTRTPGRRPYAHRVPRLLSSGHAQKPADGSRARPDTRAGLRETRNHPNGRGLDSHARWAAARAAAPHAAGTRRPGPAGPDPYHCALAASTTHQVLTAERAHNQTAPLDSPSCSEDLTHTFSDSEALGCRQCPEPRKAG